MVGGLRRVAVRSATLPRPRNSVYRRILKVKPDFSDDCSEKLQCERGGGAMAIRKLHSAKKANIPRLEHRLQVYNVRRR